MLRRATVEDVDLLVSWHADPEIARYWDDKVYSRDQIVARLERPHVDAYIVEEGGEPIGYMQAWFGETPDVGGLDMFLTPSARGRGLGPEAGRTLATFLLEQGGRRCVTVDPYLANERAVRSWAKAGFRAIEEREPDHEHRDRWLLMQYDPSRERTEV